MKITITITIEANNKQQLDKVLKALSPLLDTSTNIQVQQTTTQTQQITNRDALLEKERKQLLKKIKKYYDEGIYTEKMAEEFKAINKLPSNWRTAMGTVEELRKLLAFIESKKNLEKAGEEIILLEEEGESDIELEE